MKRSLRANYDFDDEALEKLGFHHDIHKLLENIGWKLFFRRCYGRHARRSGFGDVHDTKENNGGGGNFGSRMEKKSSLMEQ